MNTIEKGFRKLKVVLKAHELSLEIYRVTEKFPKSEIYGLVSQLRRAIVSIPANLAEGYTRQSPKEFRQSINVARGSLAEVEYLLWLSKDLNYLDEITYKRLEELRKETGKMLFGLHRSIDEKI